MGSSIFSERGEFVDDEVEAFGSARAPKDARVAGMISPSNCMPSDGVQVILVWMNLELRTAEHLAGGVETRR